jgi:hypothetical protein
MFIYMNLCICSYLYVQVENAGFEILNQWRAAPREGMTEGTMAIIARKIN